MKPEKAKASTPAPSPAIRSGIHARKGLRRSDAINQAMRLQRRYFAMHAKQLPEQHVEKFRHLLTIEILFFIDVFKLPFQINFSGFFILQVHHFYGYVVTRIYLLTIIIDHFIHYLSIPCFSRAFKSDQIF